MKVIISNDVEQGMNQYRQALNDYPISTKKADEKFYAMRNALLSLAKSSAHLYLCRDKDLGQEYTNNGELKYKNLYRFNYKDRWSKTQWAFGVIVAKQIGIIVVTSMKLASLVREDADKEDAQSKFLSMINEMNDRLHIIDKRNGRVTL